MDVLQLLSVFVGRENIEIIIPRLPERALSRKMRVSSPDSPRPWSSGRTVGNPGVTRLEATKDDIGIMKYRLETNSQSITRNCQIRGSSRKVDFRGPIELRRVSRRFRMKQDALLHAGSQEQ